MRILTVIVCLLAMTGCTRPSAGISFHDLVWSASDGLREYEGWVAKSDSPFPNELCLAGIHFFASLAETKGQSGSVGLPLAAPAMGLTGMLGYKFISTQSESGTISATLEAVYRNDPLDANVAKRLREDFIDGIPLLYSQRKVVDWKQGRVNEPPVLQEYRHRQRPKFEDRDDLAAELWRIREAIHLAVLNSPQNIVLKPGPMVLRIGYVATVTSGGQATIKLGGQQTGQFGASSGATEQNTMVLIYVNNASEADKMTCNNKSLTGVDFAALVAKANGQVKPTSAPAAPNF